jgi:hypothetical protein
MKRIGARKGLGSRLIMQAGPGIVYFKAMNGRGQAGNWIRRTIGLALILLFGPAPVLSLLAPHQEPQCQMACCRRKGGAPSCPLHHSAAGDSSGPGFQAGSDCTPGCSQTAAGPSAFAAGILLSGASLSLPNHRQKLIVATRASGLRWILDSFLHQRPPPRLFA